MRRTPRTAGGSFQSRSSGRLKKSGWKKVGSTLSGWSGGFSFHITKTGKYKATATDYGLGTPTVTTCQAKSDTARIE